MPTIREAYGEDTQALIISKTKNGVGIYTVHQSADDDLPEKKIQFEAKVDVSLKDICDEFDIEYRGDDTK